MKYCVLLSHQEAPFVRNGLMPYLWLRETAINFEEDRGAGLGTDIA